MALRTRKISPQTARLLLNNPFSLRLLPRIYNGWVRNDKNSYTFHHNILMEQHKAIYFFIPKVACSSLKLTIAREMGLVDEHTIDDNLPHAVRFPFVRTDEICGRYANYTTFAFVRNPWDRLASCYVDKICNRFHPGFARYRLFYPNMPFDEFVDSVCIIPDELSDSHFRSQTSFLEGSLSAERLDFLGRFENLEEDFGRLSEMLGMTHTNLPHVRKRQTAGYRDLYSERTRKMVALRFRNDIESFGYAF